MLWLLVMVEEVGSGQGEEVGEGPEVGGDGGDEGRGKLEVRGGGGGE